MAVRLQRRDRALQGERRHDLGQAQDAALLGRLDGIGLHALEIDPLRLGVAGHHRLQPGNPHLHGFLDHVIEPRPLERGEQIVQVAGRGLRPHLMLDPQRALLAHAGRTRIAIRRPFR